MTVFIELIKDYLRVAFALKFNHYADTVAVTLVSEVSDAFYLLVPHQFGDAFNHFGFIYLVGNLAHHNAVLAVAHLFDACLRADAH